jgi:hypothetical protein
MRCSLLRTIKVRVLPVEKGKNIVLLAEKSKGYNAPL